MVLFSSFQILEWYILIFVSFINFTFLLKVWLFASCLVFKLPNHQVSKFDNCQFTRFKKQHSKYQFSKTAYFQTLQFYRQIEIDTFCRFKNLEIGCFSIFQTRIYIILYVSVSCRILLQWNALHRCFSNCSLYLMLLDVRLSPSIVKMSWLIFDFLSRQIGVIRTDIIIV